MVESILEAPEVKSALSNLSRSTFVGYRRGIRRYLEFTGLSPKELIEEAERDRRSSNQDIKIGTPENRVREFGEWLKGVKGRFGKPLSLSEINIMCTAVHRFYKVNGYKINVPLPKVKHKRENLKERLTREEVKRLVSACRLARDKAIVLCLFQSGLRVSDLIKLNVGDVKPQIDAGKEIVTLHLVDEKEGNEFHTFFGHEAIEALKEYFRVREEGTKEVEGEELTYGSPLFSGQRGGRLGKHGIEALFRTLAVNSGLVSKERLEECDQNPVRPHALRAAFSTQLRVGGVSDDFVDYMMGHKLPFDSAYFLARLDELEEQYKKAEPRISIAEAVPARKDVDDWSIIRKMGKTLLKTKFDVFKKEFCESRGISMEKLENDLEIQDDFISEMGEVLDDLTQSRIVEPSVDGALSAVNHYINDMRNVVYECPSCHKGIKPGWQICPYCEAELAWRRCVNCGETIEPGWSLCPRCKSTEFKDLTVSELEEIG